MKPLCIEVQSQIQLKFRVKDLIDTLISHNEIIALWYDKLEDPDGSYLITRSEAHRIPDELLNKEVIKIFGTIPESISEADTINILIKYDEEDQ